MKKATFTLIFLLSMSIGKLHAQNLTLEVHGIEKTEGYLYVAVYHTADSFMKRPFAAFRVEATDTLLTIPCHGLPAGEYAISLFHDANENGQLDTGSFGIPVEQYGFSNDAEGVMGPPSYEKCRFLLQQETKMMIHLR